MPPNEFVLGPSLDNVIEPFPTVTPDGVAVKGRQQVAFDDPPTSPGGIVRLKLLPKESPDDVAPLNVYVFFVQPVESVPALAERTTTWFFKSGAPSGSIHVAPPEGESRKFSVMAPGVKPSLQPYFVQTILEYPPSA